MRARLSLEPAFVAAVAGALLVGVLLAGCGSAAAHPAGKAAASASKPPHASSAAESAYPLVQHPVAGHFRPNGVTIASCKPGKAEFVCYQQAFGNIAYKSGPNKALALVQQLLDEKNPTVMADCHTITHLIGSATLSRLHGNAALAMGTGSMLCGSGYYHGLIEFALSQAHSEQQLVAKVKNMCAGDAANRTTFILYQCVHGLGHGLMIFSGDNLPWALSMCSELATLWDKQSCSGGVFMQNFALPGPLSPFTSQFVKKSDLQYPCDWVKVEYKLYCYLQITAHVLAVTNYDWRKTAHVCDTTSDSWQAICFQSYGRDASGASQYRPASAMSYCRIAGAAGSVGMTNCVFGVVRDFVNNDTNGVRGARFCALTPLATRGFCYFGIGTILQTFGHDKAWLVSTCRSLSAQYAAECTGQLTPAEQQLIASYPTS